MWPILFFYAILVIITGPPTHTVGGQYCFAVCRLASVVVVCRMSRSVALHCGPAGGFTRAGQAMTSCRLQSNYSFTAARRASRVSSR